MGVDGKLDYDTHKLVNVGKAPRTDDFSSCRAITFDLSTRVTIILSYFSYSLDPLLYFASLQDILYKI